MIRTTISIPEELIEKLRQVSAQRRVSMAALIREAVQEKLISLRPMPRSLGVGASGHWDTARRAGDERPKPNAWR